MQNRISFAVLHNHAAESVSLFDDHIIDITTLYWLYALDVMSKNKHV